ncbi:MAG: hypothetical protein ABJL18_00275 [Hyphomicrobiales bacterium]
MRQPIQRIAQDLSSALNNISRLANKRTREAQDTMSDAIADSIQEVLPEADISISQSSQTSIIDVSDENILARELGSLSREADQPIARALEDTFENVTTR